MSHLFQFKQTKMLQDAQVSGIKVPSVGRHIAYFLLIFGIAMLSESLVVSVAQIIAILTNEGFRTSLTSPSFNFKSILDAAMDALNHLPSWVMVVQLFATVIMIFCCLFYCRKFEKRSYLSLGFAKSGAMAEYAVGLLLGFVMLSLPALACVGMGCAALVPANDIAWGMIILYFLGFLVQGLSEEIFCRSFLMVSLSRGHKPWLCIMVNALMFASLHIFNPGITPLALLNLTLFGVFASIYTLRRGSIWGIAAIHSIWNFAQGNIYGVAVSGMGNNPTILQWSSESDAWYINGGSFGLEGGLAVTLVLVISTLVILATPTKKSELVTS